jgi:vanillate O-demethylase monooxygenase subunit
MSNRCAHRFAPLHLGKLEGDAVSCPYHGLRYNSSGHCILNPNGNQRVPTGARLKVYPTIERYGAVWIWPGDPEQADGGLIPNLSFMEDHVRYAPVTGAIHVRANYRLIIDNLVDGAHVSTVHHDTLACESFLRATPDVKVEGNTIWANLNCPPGMPGPIWTQLWEAEYGSVPGPMDHWATSNWTPASIIIQETGMTPLGQPREKGIRTLNCHMLTPETDQTTHYFWGISRSFQLSNRELDEQMKIGATYAFTQQDEPMLAAIQEESQDRDFWEMKPALIADDTGVVLARRKLDELLKAQSTPSNATTTGA